MYEELAQKLKESAIEVRQSTDFTYYIFAFVGRYKHVCSFVRVSRDTGEEFIHSLNKEQLYHMTKPYSLID